MQTNRIGSPLSPTFRSNNSKISTPNAMQTPIATAQTSVGDRFEFQPKTAKQPLTFGTRNLLHDAVAENNGEDIDYYLADQGLEYLNEQDEKGNTPLHVAADKGHAQAAWNLLDYPGIDPSLENNEYKTALDIARAKKHPEIVQILENLIGRTGLHLASSNNHVTELNELLMKDVSPAKLNKQDEEGNTALHLAAGNGNPDIAGLLLNQPGIDPSLKNHDKETALQRAKKHNNTEVIPLLEALRGCNALHLAVGRGETRLLPKLLAKTDIETLNAKDNDGNTPLHIAAQCGNLEAVQMIGSQAGIDPSLENNEDETALEVAEAAGHKNIVQLLERFRGRNGIHIAAEKNQVTALRAFLKNAGPDTINAKDLDGNTALHLAAGYQSVDATRILLTQPGIDRDLTNYNNETPLHIANKLKYTDIIRLLNGTRGIRQAITNLSAFCPLAERRERD